MIDQELMVLTFRIALGADSDIVDLVSEYLLKNWHKLNTEYQRRIRRETKLAIAYGWAGIEHDQETWLLMLENAREKEAHNATKSKGK